MATKDFVDYTPSTGSNNATINVTAAENKNLGERNMSLSVTGSGINKNVSIDQEGVNLVHFQGIVECFTPNSSSFGFAVGVGSSGSDQTPRVNVPNTAQIGYSYATIQLEHELTSTGLINVMMAFFGIKFAGGLNYMDFRVVGLKSDIVDWEAKEVGRILPQSQEILKYLEPTTYENDLDNYFSRYICPEGIINTSKTLVFTTQVDPSWFIEGGIPGTNTNTGMIIQVNFNM